MEKRAIKDILMRGIGLITCIAPAIFMTYLFSKAPMTWSEDGIVKAFGTNVIKFIFLTTVFTFVYTTIEVGFWSLNHLSFRIDQRYYFRNLMFVMFGTYESYYVMRRQLNRIIFWIVLVFPIGLFLIFGKNTNLTFKEAVLLTLIIYLAKSIFAGFGMTINTLVCKIMFPGDFGKVPDHTTYDREYGFPAYGLFGFIYCSPKLKTG